MKEVGLPRLIRRPLSSTGLEAKDELDRVCYSFFLEKGKVKVDAYL